MVAYRYWAGVKDFEPHVIITLVPLFSWQNVNPMPWWHDAFVSRVTGFVGSKCLMRRFAARIYFKLSIASFFFERVILSLLQLCAIVSTQIFSSGRDGAHTWTSSTIFLVQGRPSIIASERRHHSSDDVFKPCGILR